MANPKGINLQQQKNKIKTMDYEKIEQELMGLIQEVNSDQEMSDVAKANITAGISASLHRIKLLYDGRVKI